MSQINEDKVVDLHALRVFLTTAETGSMAATATRFNVTQSAISQSVRALEEYFGVVLIDRSTRPLVLTPAGLHLRTRGSTLLSQALNLRGSVIDASQGIKPDLRIGLVDSFAATCGTALARRLIRHVDHLSVRTGLTPNLSEDLLRREFDVILTTDPLDDMSGIARHELMSESFFLITPRSMTPTPANLGDLRRLPERLPLIRFNQQSHLGVQIERTLRQHAIRAPRHIEVDTADTLTSMVAGGLGWAITTPLCVMQAAQHARNVGIRMVPALASSRSIYVLARDGEYETLVKDVFLHGRAVLEEDAVPALRKIGVALEKSIRIKDWKADE
ncbi:MAG: LysR family transcriptional regulator [Lautropia sp.]